MSARIVNIDSTRVAVHNNQQSAYEFTQSLALDKSQCGDSKSFFVADLGKIQTAVAQWQKHLPRVRPFYSLACNSTPMLLRILSAVPQIGLHCITRRNVDTALEYVDAERLFYTNACWTKATVRQANTSGVGLLGFNSEGDLTRMSNENVNANLILNVALSASSGEAETALGCPLDRAADLLTMAAELGLNCVGVGFDLGAAIPRAAVLDRAVEVATQLLAIGRSLGLPMRVLSLGGGFPPLRCAANSPSFESICAHVNAALDYHIPIGGEFDDVEVIATPGRFFAASMFALVTSIQQKSEIDASAITNDDFDAGQRGFVYHINEGYYGPFGCRSVANCNPKCAPLFAAVVDVDYVGGGDDDDFYGSILGPYHDVGFDTVQEQCRFRQMHAGEWLFWDNLGAYSMDNCESLDDDDDCDTPAVYYFANERDWKSISRNINRHSFTYMENTDGHSDEESEDSAVNSDIEDDVSWLFGINVD